MAHKTYSAEEVRKKMRTKKGKLKKSVYGKVTHPKAKFFERHAGSSYLPGETKQQGRNRGGRSLAAAERLGRARGWYVDWEYDPEPYETDNPDDQPSEVLTAVLRDAEGNVLTSLGGIGDPDRAYRRVVEAELMSEVLASGRHERELRRGF